MNGVPQTTGPASTSGLGVRILCMVLFAFVFWIVSCTLAVAAVAQLLARLVTGRASPELVRFGGGLARYTAQVVEYLTFVTDTPPYPLSRFPG
jgi:hypothetical protein